MSPVNKKSAALIIISGKTVLLCKRATECYITKKAIPFGGYWSFIAGGIEKDESSIECVIREAKEEISVDVNKDDIKHIENFKNDSGKIIEVFGVFLEKLPKIKLNPEHTIYMWFDYSHIDEFPYKIDDKFKQSIKKFVENL